MFKIKGSEEQEPVVELRLKQANNSVTVVAEGTYCGSKAEKSICTFHGDGTLAIHRSAQLDGVETNSHGEIIISV